MNTKLRIEVSAISSDTLTSGHKVHVRAVASGPAGPVLAGPVFRAGAARYYVSCTCACAVHWWAGHVRNMLRAIYIDRVT